MPVPRIHKETSIFGDETVRSLATRVTQTEEDVTTAIEVANGTASLVRQYGSGVLVCRTGNTVGALVNADGSFDVVDVTWSGSTPTAGAVLASFASNKLELAKNSSSGSIEMLNGNAVIKADKTFIGGASTDYFGLLAQNVQASGSSSVVVEAKDIHKGDGIKSYASSIYLDTTGHTYFRQFNAYMESDGSYPLQSANQATIAMNPDGSINIEATGGIFCTTAFGNDIKFKVNTRNVMTAPEVLYNNATGTTGTVTLSASAANYNHMRIYIRAVNDSNQAGSVDVYSPNSKYVSLEITNGDNNNGGTWVKSRMCQISGTSITSTQWGEGKAGTSGNTSTTNNVYIYRVEAWNE